MAAYSFVTHWRFAAPLEQVWQELDAAERYTDWWPAIRDYYDLTPEIHGLGARAERVVRGILPYELRYMTTVTKYVPPREIAYDAARETPTVINPPTRVPRNPPLTTAAPPLPP
jgi:uncharacterized protein YndB with AHSA1/START domain